MATTLIAPLSDDTTAAIADLVEYTIAREYGQDIEATISGACALALAGIELDSRGALLIEHGSDADLAGYAYHTLRMLVADGLEARRCQCQRLRSAGCSRSRAGVHICNGHYEADVPPIDGALLCGTCHIEAFEARG